jgi:hypothetical protein
MAAGLHLYMASSLCVCAQISLIYFNFFFSGGTGVWSQGFGLAKQGLKHLSHTSSTFCSCYFGDEVSWTICRRCPWISNLPISAFQIARTPGIIHQHPANSPSLKGTSHIWLVPIPFQGRLI